MAQTQHWQSGPIGLDSVEAELAYPAFTGEWPGSCTLPARERREDLRVEPRRVRIRNARRLEVPPTLERNGFELREHRTRLTDFSHEGTIRDIYYPEAIDLIQRVTGAARVVVLDHARRSAPSSPAASKVREPVPEEHLLPEGPTPGRWKRHAIIHLWRPTTYALQNWPLAICDAASIAPNDRISTPGGDPEQPGETLSFKYNPEHRWFYYPEQLPEEALLLEVYDSLTDASARVTAYTAFDDPTSRPGARPRPSIELRALACWD